MTAASLSLVIITEMACAFLGSAFAAFVAVLVRAPTLIVLLIIPSTLLVARLAGRWMRRRENPPGNADVIVGSLLYALVSTGLGTSSAGYLGAAGAFVGSCALSLMLWHSARSVWARPVEVGHGRA